MSMFVPPFLKNVKSESLNHTVLKDNVRTPAFVPPFKKQRTIVQESTSKPQEEDKQHHLFVMPFKNNTYVPPTKNIIKACPLDVNLRSLPQRPHSWRTNCPKAKVQ